MLSRPPPRICPPPRTPGPGKSQRPVRRLFLPPVFPLSTRGWEAEFFSRPGTRPDSVSLCSPPPAPGAVGALPTQRGSAWPGGRGCGRESGTWRVSPRIRPLPSAHGATSQHTCPRPGQTVWAAAHSAGLPDAPLGVEPEPHTTCATPSGPSVLQRSGSPGRGGVCEPQANIPFGKTPPVPFGCQAAGQAAATRGQQRSRPLLPPGGGPQTQRTHPTKVWRHYAVLGLGHLKKLT